MTATTKVATSEGLSANGAVAVGIDSEVLMVRPAQAAVWLQECKFPYQRNLSRAKVEELKAAIVAGEFEPTMIKLYLFGGQEHLVDGQHRLTAIIETGVPTPLVVARQHAQSWTQVLKAYGRIDINKVRSQAEAMYAARIHEHAGLSVEETQRVASALKHLMTGFNSVTTVSGGRWQLKNRDMLARGVLQWKDEGQAYFRALDESLAQHRRKMSAAIVMAVALVTFRYQKDVASVFWRSVAMQDRLEPHAGEWWAAEIVRDPLRWDQRRSAEYARRLASTWNAAFKGRKLQKTQVHDSKRPICILGTPYNGQREIREEF